ncbi:MAG TPA: DeoR/GlpR transcriptional regulator [Firmicutes bacterium]|nr:DeoR/GlpR transcriptional regulator [Bacillota bacterium]
MLASERRKQISRIILETRAVTVLDLAQRFQVATETIRRDLKKLEAEGVLKRTHGGAIIEESTNVLPFAQRNQQNIEEKRQIAARAAQLVKDGQTLILDNGTTTMELARALVNKKDITVVTNSLVIARELAYAPGVTVEVVGGVLRKAELSLVGPTAKQFIERIRVDWTFLAAAGVTVDHGPAVSNNLEAEIKTLMAEAAAQTVLLVDSSKLGKPAMVSYLPLEKLDMIITDSKANREVLTAFQEKGVKVLQGNPVS